MIRRLEHVSYEDKFRQLHLFNLEKRRLWGNLFEAFQYFQRADTKDEEQAF
ncbi:hypothetical protein HGM15179_008170, partial [Zosterops borbonicus]